ncbi:MAG: DUF1080 domain-containing protein [Anaerolineae bacterium]|jgi:photosystem II stability/assembly factor-like uncharacterized protein|nr:DUF1080 domain-containing protein [Anaerolineae bacterium]MBT7190588.1 DUF1080 domain-containing protein [Anaerolineae bacterium]MBT7324466.1 DUF1080 domain-containing protein [Anaerolineae bacterium]
MIRKNFFGVFVTLLILFGISTIAFAQNGGFTETFDDPELSGWEQSPGVEVRDGILSIPAESFVAAPGAWGNMELSILLRRVGEGDFVISYGNHEGNAYHLLNSASRISLQHENAGALEEVAATEMEFIPAGEWFQLSIYVIGDEHRVLINGQPAILVNTPMEVGGISIETFTETAIEIDSFELIAEDISSAPDEVDPDMVEPETEEVPSTAPTISPPLSSSELRWVRLGGPPGGTGYDIRYSFDDPNIWYVTDSHGGVHVSVDNGYTWQASNIGIPGQSGPTGDAIGVFCLTVDPNNSQIIWAGTVDTGHLYRSKDGGKTWVERDNGISIKYDGLTFRGITVDPTSSDIVYAMAEVTDESATEQGQGTWKSGTGGVVYHTTNAGESWDTLWEGDMPSSLARYLWVDPRNTDVLYVSTGIFDRGAVGDNDSLEDPFGGLGILKSTDGGQSWRILGKENGLRNLYIGSLYMHPDNPDILLAAAGHLFEPDTLPYLERLQSEGQPSPMGIYRTTDGGENWTQTLAAFEVFSSVDICPSDPDIVYAGSEDSIYRSEDSGVTWQVTASPWGPPSVSVGFPIDMQCDPRDTDRLFVNNYGGGNFLSEDAGKTWINASQGYTGAQIFGLSIAPSEPERIYVAGFGGLWRSDDAGTSWQGLKNPPPGLANMPSQGIAVDPTDSNHVLVAKHKILESKDGGKSWVVRWSMQVLVGQGISEELISPMAPTIAFAPSDAKTLYIGFGHENCLLSHEINCETTPVGILISNDGGASWDLSDDPQIKQINIFDVAVEHDDAQHVYAATEVGLFESVDGGKKWTMVSVKVENNKIHVVAVDPSDSQKILVGVERDGIYRSIDGGVTWQHSIAGLEPNGSMHDIVFDPTNSETIYASDLFSGVYRSTDGGNMWIKINEGLRSRATRSLAVSADGQHLYVGTNEDGVLRLDLSGAPPEGVVTINSSAENDSSGAQPAIPCLGSVAPLALIATAWMWRHKTK